MPAPPSPAPQTLALGPLTVTFTWSGDRWSHRVALPGAAGSPGLAHETAARELVWESVEGAAPEEGDPRWPASPALVELSRLDTPRGPTLLGVGRAGRSHFSASIGPDAERPGWLRFEIACRHHEPPVWLGSTYRAAAGLVAVRPRFAHAAPRAPLPATVQWSYRFGPDGLAAVEGSLAAGARGAGRP